MNWKEYFDYMTKDGTLIWKMRSPESFKTVRGHAVFTARDVGKKAGCYSKIGGGNKLYASVAVNQIPYKLHRIVWEMHHGEIPKGIQVDHINGNIHDNRIQNLRLASDAQNRRNCKKRSNTIFRLKGVFLTGSNRYAATIRVDKKLVYLGVFDTIGMAGVARAKAALMYHGKFARFT